MNGYLKYSPSTSTHGKFIQSAITAIRGGKRALEDILATKAQMVQSIGDGSQDADYATWAAAIGAPDNATARGISDELESLRGKISSDASTDHVNAAIEQACAKLLI